MLARSESESPLSYGLAIPLRVFMGHIPYLECNRTCPYQGYKRILSLCIWLQLYGSFGP